MQHLNIDTSVVQNETLETPFIDDSARSQNPAQESD